MAEPNKQLTGIIIRADGTVPFDEGLDPDVRAHIIAYITDQGVAFDPVPGTNSIKLRDWVPAEEVI